MNWQRYSGRALTAIALAGATFVAFGAAPAAATSGWSHTKAVDTNAEASNIAAMSCVKGTAWCMAVDGTGNYLVLSNSEWSKPVHFDPKVNGAGAGVTSVSCATTKLCAAVDALGYGLTWNGAKWSTPKRLAGNGNGSIDITSVSCATSKFCIAVDSNGDAIAYSNGSWGATKVIDPQFKSQGELGILGVSCPTSSFCMAVDSKGYAVEYSSGAWSSPSLVDTNIFAPGTAMHSVSCPTTKFCMAVDDVGFALSFNGTTWSSPTLVLGADHSSFSAVSCATAKFCVAGINAANASGYIGDVVMYTGSWKSPQHVDSTGFGAGEDIVSMSCSTPYYCAGGDNQGYVVVYDTRLSSKPAVSVPSKVTPGRAFTAKVTVSGPVIGSGQPTPTGAATVYVGSRHCTAHLSGRAGKATGSCQIGTLSKGTYDSRVGYPGDGTFRPSSASGVKVTVT